MKRLLAIALAGCLAFAGPAMAGIAIINGGGTGGVIAIGSNNSAITTVTTAPSTVDEPVGSFILVGLSVRANSAFTGCTDSAGNTWPTPTFKGAPSGQLTAWAAIISTIDRPIGSTITCTNASTTAKSIIEYAFSGVASATPDAATPTSTNGSTTAIAIGPSGTWGCPGVTNCNLQIAIWSVSVTASPSGETVGFISGPSLAIPYGLHTAYQITSATTPTSYAATNATAGNWGALMPGFDASVASGTQHLGTLLGVGQ